MNKWEGVVREEDETRRVGQIAGDIVAMTWGGKEVPAGPAIPSSFQKLVRDAKIVARAYLSATRGGEMETMSSERPFAHCAAPHRCNPAAHGNITVVEQRDDLTREINVNGQHREIGDWHDHYGNVVVGHGVEFGDVPDA